jgi:hypothetical protein
MGDFMIGKLWAFVPGDIKLLIILGAVSVIGLGGLGVKLKITTLERDLEKCRGGIAVDALETSEAVRAAEVKALETARKDDHERQTFITENKIALERNRQAGDGPLAPVQRDMLERVRQRYSEKFPDKRNP